MKNVKYLVASCLALCGLYGCDKNEMPLFDTSYAALNIWFGGSQTVLDSTTYNYSYAMGEKSLVFNARVAGVPVDYDRSFQIEVYEGSLDEAQGSYRVETYTIKAGEVEAQCPIYFNTSLLKDNKSFTEKDGRLCFRMIKNNDFVAGTQGSNALIVCLKNYLGKPDEWDSAAYPMRPYSAYFGSYSKVKYQFMISELGLVDFHINYSTTKSYDEETNTISASYATYLKQKLQVALEEYNSNPNNPDTPLKDETGSVVVF